MKKYKIKVNEATRHLEELEIPPQKKPVQRDQA